ncbi:MAG: sodium/proton-translocating pyrophosphatase, partial [Myxococcales bacterium]|nr:sodium/proton-translocating pyrophosphatase [Myxococcales bacterium]
KDTPLHDATVVGDMVGDPFKDTSSVALNPVIKFTTLFGLLAVELAEQMKSGGDKTMPVALGALFFAVSVVFVYRSFYNMRIESSDAAPTLAAAGAGGGSVSMSSDDDDDGDDEPKKPAKKASTKKADDDKAESKSDKKSDDKDDKKAESKSDDKKSDKSEPEAGAEA